MGMSAVSPIAILLAALVAFVFSFVWHRLFERSWMTAAGYKGRPALKAGPLIVVFVAFVVMAGMLSGLNAHIGDDLQSSMINAVLAWAGFVLATIVVDHSFEARSRKLTLINGLHWLGAFLIMGLILAIVG